jgi:hypothetical protein
MKKLNQLESTTELASLLLPTDHRFCSDSLFRTLKQLNNAEMTRSNISGSEVNHLKGLNRITFSVVCERTAYIVTGGVMAACSISYDMNKRGYKGI